MRHRECRSCGRSDYRGRDLWRFRTTVERDLRARAPALHAEDVDRGAIGPPRALVEPLRAAMRNIDDRAPLYRPSTLEDRFLTWAAPTRAAGVLMLTVGATALTIAVLGIYGVISYFVNLRPREFGIRLALVPRPQRSDLSACRGSAVVI